MEKRVHFGGEAITSTGTAGSPSALALTCSGGVGAARVPDRCSCRSPAPNRVPGPNPLPDFSAPPCAPLSAGLPGPPALSAPPRVRPLREQEPKGEGSEDRSQGGGLEERRIPRGRDPRVQIPTSTVPCYPLSGFWGLRHPTFNLDKDSSLRPPREGRSGIWNPHPQQEQE